MKRVLSASLTTTVAALGLVYAQAEPVLKAHFAGIDNLTKREDAKTLRTVWQLKQTQAFRKEALDKLARRLGDNNAEREATLRELGERGAKACMNLFPLSAFEQEAQGLTIYHQLETQRG